MSKVSITTNLNLIKRMTSKERFERLLWSSGGTVET